MSRLMSVETSTRPSAQGRRRPRPADTRGFTLVEIIVVLVLFGIISGVVMRVITRQQRFYQGANQIMTQRSQLRQATSVLPIDLRTISSVGEDFLVVSDSSIDFDMTVGTGIVCEIIPGVNGTQVALPPLDLANGQVLTTLYGGSAPLLSGGYKVYIYNDSSSVGNEEDVWQEFALAADVVGDPNWCLASPFTDVSADAGKRRLLLTLANPPGVTAVDPVTGGPISQYIRLGAPVRIVKTVRYALFQYADGKWYLGFADYNAASATFNALLPVSGPYEPYASGTGAAPGLRFRYYDVDGVEIAPGAGAADRARIARVDLIVRGKTASPVRTAGIQNGAFQQYRDSLAVSVMLRNRN